jgi:1-acyl-sn-glycerol-3-phosphate acyltransferase
MRHFTRGAPWQMPLGRLLPASLRAAALLTLGLLVLTLHFLVLLVPALLKLAIPHEHTRRLLNRCMFAIVESWTTVTGWLYRLFLPVREWRITLPVGLERQRSYLVICNHQTWVDILLLFWAFNRRVPVLRFFMKAELRRVPIIGFAVFASDSAANPSPWSILSRARGSRRKSTARTTRPSVTCCAPRPPAWRPR